MRSTKEKGEILGVRGHRMDVNVGVEKENGENGYSNARGNNVAGR